MARIWFFVPILISLGGFGFGAGIPDKVHTCVIAPATSLNTSLNIGTAVQHCNVVAGGVVMQEYDVSDGNLTVVNETYRESSFYLWGNGNTTFFNFSKPKVTYSSGNTTILESITVKGNSTANDESFVTPDSVYYLNLKYMCLKTGDATISIALSVFNSTDTVFYNVEFIKHCKVILNPTAKIIVGVVICAVGAAMVIVIMVICFKCWSKRKYQRLS